MNWKTVKIPEWAYQNALVAKGDVLTGALSVPGRLRVPARCPRCRSEVERVDDPYPRVQCTRCNYRQEAIDDSESSLTSFGIGVLLGLGLAALLSSNEGPVETRRTGAAQAIRRRGRSRTPQSAADIDEEVRRTRRSRRRKSA